MPMCGWLIFGVRSCRCAEAGLAGVRSMPGARAQSPSYSASVTWSPHSVSPSVRDRWVMMWSGAQQRFDGAALVHRAVALGGFVEWQCEVEDFPGVDLPVADQLDEFG